MKETILDILGIIFRVIVIINIIGVGVIFYILCADYFHLKKLKQKE
jgi:hypothetical protein